MAAWIIVLALVNGALGFAAAVELGRRHRRRCARACDPTPADAAAGAGGTANSAAAALEAIVPPPGGVQPALAPHEPQPWPDDSPAGSPAASPAAGGPAPSESRCEAAVQGLHDASQRYQGQLSELDRLLRASPPEDPPAVASYAATLREAGGEYLDQRRAAGEEFYSAFDAHQDLHTACDGVRAALDAEASKIGEAQKTLEGLDFEGRPGESCEQVLAQTARLLGANDEVHEALEVALVEAARSENRLVAPGDAEGGDLPGGMTSRAGLERQLARLWQDDPQRTRQLAVAALDLDQFGRLNEHFGREMGDRILRAIGGIVAAEGREQTTSARFSGQRFVLLFPDGDLRMAVNVVERIRQIVEKAHFRRHEFDLQVTLSCGVTAAAPQDTSKTLFERAEATMREAKRYGRNRTFVHEGRYPTPVVPPNLTVSEKKFDL